MIPILVTQRMQSLTDLGEVRDACDRRWSRFLLECDLLPVLAPNHLPTVRHLWERLRPWGILLTGGDSPGFLGGDDAERDQVENHLLDLAIEGDFPLMGVCRGMQMIQHWFGVPLRAVAGHVAPTLTIDVGGRSRQVNSYHHFGTHESRPPLGIWATAADGTVKAVRHNNKPILGIMWHPERFPEKQEDDILLFRTFFGSYKPSTCEKTSK
ncbi:MAG: putative gamma-glutamyl-gamma-aminobutyrate hydrolase [Magnetococcales bacterium]|nr:putative gamma-glutamyl-gamma-aminobutyrate hydrolase [Magnetococcales bacterium]